MNRLSSEKSPYLQMHAENPVDWYPWSEEAFAQARARDCPIFLSIGYSSCHWCHVIAHESFEDARVASALNADFISVKVDKEERPDVDAVYMDAVEMSTGSGGWPMTLLLTPDGIPFFAATYLRKDALLELLWQAAEMWRTERAGVNQLAEEFADQMRRRADDVPVPRTPDSKWTEKAVDGYAAQYDRQWGGFGRAPKFPSAHNLLFLLAHYARTGEKTALEMAEGTLAAMARGGLFDHIGGGFCRYSVDHQWRVPHFEKMLYDNALLLWAYSEAWRLTRNPLWRDVARQTADYVLREMTGPEGEFYCAQDADSANQEGAYYVFSREELLDLLGKEDGQTFCDGYGILPEGNFEGKSIPNRIGKAMDEGGGQAMDEMRAKVYRYRRERLPLGRDDKVLTSWNALMIAALCAAAEALEMPEYLDAARRAEAFLWNHLRGEDGELLLRFRDGEAKGSGVLSDYAFFLLALVMLYGADGSREDLRKAEQIADRMLRDFSDEEHGGLYLYGNHAEKLITRPRETWDAAMPSGNSCAALALQKLAEDSGNPRWKAAADAQLRFVAGAAYDHPTAHGFALLAITFALKTNAAQGEGGVGMDRMINDLPKG